MNPKVLLTGVLLGLVVAAGLFFKSARNASRSEDFPGGMYWLCTNCQHGFSTSREKFAAWAREHPDELLPCPECGKNTSVVARKCPTCGKYYTQSNVVVDGKVCCPLCGEPLP